MKALWPNTPRKPDLEHSEVDETTQAMVETTTEEVEEKAKRIEESAGTEASSSSTLRQPPAEDGGVEETGEEKREERTLETVAVHQSTKEEKAREGENKDQPVVKEKTEEAPEKTDGGEEGDGATRDSLKQILAAKAQWHHLDFFAQSRWKCEYFGVPEERFKMVAWA